MKRPECAAHGIFLALERVFTAGAMAGPYDDPGIGLTAHFVAAQRIIMAGALLISVSIHATTWGCRVALSVGVLGKRDTFAVVAVRSFPLNQVTESDGVS